MLGYIYFFVGLSFVLILLALIIHYYSGKRHKEVEEAKYRMLDDDDE